MTKNLQYYANFVTHEYILNVAINILLATIVTPGFALDTQVKHFILKTSTIEILIC